MIDLIALKTARTHWTMEQNLCFYIKCLPRSFLQVSLSNPLPPLHFSPAAERHVRSFVYLWNFTHLRPKVSKMTLHCVHVSTMAWALEKRKTKSRWCMCQKWQKYPNQGVGLSNTGEQSTRKKYSYRYCK